MKIIGHVHQAPPTHMAGAEVMLHALLREMVKRGHDACVIATWASGNWKLDGVCYHGLPTSAGIHCLYAWSDVVITHLDETHAAVGLATNHQRPLAHLVHNTDQLRQFAVRESECQVAIANSQVIYNDIGGDVAKVVVRPTIDADDYRVDPGDAVTLINLSEAKGGPLFYELARVLPDYPFIGVLGGYGEQAYPPELPNLTILPNSPRIRDVYAQTKILLMPSIIESWGRCAIEAACSGIPTICHPTPGLQESLGAAGIFADRGDLTLWKATIDHLMRHPDSYQKASAAALDRFNAIDSKHDYDTFERALLDAVTSGEYCGASQYFSGVPPLASG